MSNQTYIDGFLGQMSNVLRLLPIKDIDAAIELLFDTWKRGGTVFIAGNGGSSSTASHFACDLAKWTLSEGKSRSG